MPELLHCLFPTLLSVLEFLKAAWYEVSCRETGMVSEKTPVYAVAAAQATDWSFKGAVGAAAVNQRLVSWNGLGNTLNGLLSNYWQAMGPFWLGNRDGTPL